MLLSQDFFQNLIHVGALFYLVCFLFRNQILLRCFAILGDMAYTAYYFGAADQPLWNAMFWSGTNIMINIFMILLIWNDGRARSLTDNELKLYRSMNALTPGEFRKLTAIGKWRTATEDIALTKEGENLSELYYILEGEVDIEKSGRKIEVKPELFIGEIAYLLKKPATATVTLKKGSLYIAWPHATLTKTFAKQESLKNALSTLLSADLATKVARS
jgi:Cyclic nucleotide-binding domain